MAQPSSCPAPEEGGSEVSVTVCRRFRKGGAAAPAGALLAPPLHWISAFPVSLPTDSGASWHRFPNTSLALDLSPPPVAFSCLSCLVPGQTSIHHRFRILPRAALGSREASSLEQWAPVPQTLSLDLLSWGQWQPLSRQGVKRAPQPAEGAITYQHTSWQWPCILQRVLRNTAGEQRQRVGTEHFLLSRCRSRCCTRNSISHPADNPHLFHLHLVSWETEAQRGQVTCWRAHSLSEMEPDSKPGCHGNNTASDSQRTKCHSSA